MRRWRRWVGAVAVLVLLPAGAVAAVRARDSAGSRPAPGPAATRVAPVLVPAPVLRAVGAPAGAPTPAGLRRALAGALRDPALGRSVATVVAPSSGRLLLSLRGESYLPPASTAKIVTAVAVLRRLGPAARLTTRVVRGAAAGQVVLVGGGDPTLTAGTGRPTGGYPAPARLADLAAGTARALQGAGLRRVTVAVDTFRYTGPTTGPGWLRGYVTGGDVAPVQALELDGGRASPGRPERRSDPAVAAGVLFARMLAGHGIEVPGSGVGRALAPPRAQTLASVQSPPLSALVERMLTTSDNDLAEALARQVATSRGLPASFVGAATAVRASVAELGVEPTSLRLVDGSGLSRLDRARPTALVRLLTLAVAPDHPELRSVVTGLAVGGFTGTLASRFGTGPAARGAGTVRAKTGTLRGVSTLAGLAVDASGDLLAFAFVAAEAPARFPAQAALDRLAATLTGCGCR